MPQQTQHTRRQLLKVAGSATVVGLAGCTSLGAQPTDGDEGGGAADDGEEMGDHHDEEMGDHHDEEEGDNHDEEEGDNHDEEEGDNHDEEEGDNHDEEEGDNHDEEEGDDHGHNHDEGAPEGPAATAEVTMTTDGSQHHFAPHAVWVEPGGTVTWTLESGSHDVVAYHPDNERPLRMPEGASPWRSDLLSDEGETFEHTFETEGVYDFFCTPHEAVGMVGTVIVGEPDAHGQPALEEPQSTLPDGARSELADLAEIVTEALGHEH